jgi:hypothetical protein
MFFKIYGKGLVLAVSVFLNLMGAVCCAISDTAWVIPQEVHTIFYQGMNNSQVQLSKYTGDYGFIATTGEHVVSSKGVSLIYKPFVGTEIDEVRLSNFDGYTLNPWYLVHELVSRLSNKSFNVEVSGKSTDGHSVAAHAVRLSKICIGQDNDINSHKLKYEKFIQTFPDKPLILYGVSRGTAATFNSVAMNGYDLNKIKLIVLEGAIDSIEHVLSERSIVGKLPQGLVNFFLALFTSYDPDGLQPIENINNFPENVPVVLITSEVDAEVPCVCTKALAEALNVRGKNPVHLLVLKNSRHPRYMMDDEADTQNYLAFMHTLYKKYDLPYIPKFAKLGEEMQILAEVTK